jgi:anti-sigma regulatory factor (Ser/Thr protein kinase)
MPAHAHAATCATPRTHTRTYPGTADQASAVRADLRALLRDCPRADDALLCGSELAANAALHSRSARPGGTYTVRATAWHGDHVRIEVTDAGGPWPPHARRPGADEERPHGLDLVTAFADRWGITDTPTSRTVWFAIAWDTP